MAPTACKNSQSYPGLPSFSISSSAAARSTKSVPSTVWVSSSISRSLSNLSSSSLSAAKLFWIANEAARRY